MADNTKLGHPNTQVRLPYIEIRAAIQNESDTIAGFQNAKLIGSVKKFGVSHERGTGIRREFRGKLTGVIKETYPQLPTYKLSLEKVLLVEETALKSFGFPTNDLLNQTDPIAIWLIMYGPKADGSTDKTILFTGCYFEDSSFEFDLESPDLRVVQTIDFTFAEMKE